MINPLTLTDDVKGLRAWKAAIRLLPKCFYTTKTHTGPAGFFLAEEIPLVSPIRNQMGTPIVISISNDD